jgi:maleamate amidohydrolase
VAIWDDVLPEVDREVFAAAGWGRRAGFGRRPVLMLIDVNYNFVGDRPEPILESIKRWHFSCGERGWRGVAAIEPLLARARRLRLPVLYTTNPRRPDGFDLGVWTLKGGRADEEVDVEGHLGNQIVAPLKPGSHDIFIEKKKPSAFFGTPLASYLVMLRADTVILTGTTTSGCVRASAVDAISYNFRVVVPEECVWDRGELTHKVNLFDLHQKYCDVVPVQEVLGHLARVPEGLFDEDLPALRRTPAGAGS